MLMFHSRTMFDKLKFAGLSLHRIVTALAKWLAA